jgi:hypothetical protein
VLLFLKACSDDGAMFSPALARPLLEQEDCSIEQISNVLVATILKRSHPQIPKVSKHLALNALGDEGLRTY